MNRKDAKAQRKQGPVKACHVTALTLNGVDMMPFIAKRVAERAAALPPSAPPRLRGES